MYAAKLQKKYRTAILCFFLKTDAKYNSAHPKPLL